jgi:HEPN domain-containing protein
MNVHDEIVKQWIEKADHDLGTAKLIFLHIPHYYDTISFHCQQSVEKYIKSVLFFYNIEFKKTHNLVNLMGLLSTKINKTDDLIEKAILLNGFSTQIRYPDEVIELTKEELERAIQISDEFRIFALEQIGFDSNYLSQ